MLVCWSCHEMASSRPLHGSRWDGLAHAWPCSIKNAKKAANGDWHEEEDSVPTGSM